MNSLEQAAKALANDQLGVIAKHLEAFAREQNKECSFNLERLQSACQRPFTQTELAVEITRSQLLERELAQLKEQNRELEELVQIQAQRPQMTNENLVELDQLRRANRELLKDKERLNHLESLKVEDLEALIVEYWTTPVVTLRNTIDKALDKAALAKGDV